MGKNPLLFNSLLRLLYVTLEREILIILRMLLAYITYSDLTHCMLYVNVTSNGDTAPSNDDAVRSVVLTLAKII